MTKPVFQIIFGIVWFLIGMLVINSFYYHEYSPVPSYVPWLFMITGVGYIVRGLFDFTKKSDNNN
jgi:hypothetical protein